ncbi:MAG: agmatine deiminase family protein [Bacteroidia bacterium]
METLPYDDIHHIDMHIKLLDEETLLVGEYPQGIADGPQIEANLQYVLSNFNSVFGTPYKVIRIPMPPDASNSYPNVGGDYRTYTNSVFVNNTIILPTYSQQYDTTAIHPHFITKHFLVTPSPASIAIQLFLHWVPFIALRKR